MATSLGRSSALLAVGVFLGVVVGWLLPLPPAASQNALPAAVMVAQSASAQTPSAPEAEPLVKVSPAAVAPSMPASTLSTTPVAATPLAAPLTQPLTTPPAVIAIMGDSLADGFWGGLFRVARKNKSISLLQLGKNGTGLGHPAKYDWVKGVSEIIAQQHPDIAVITMGINDRVSLILDESQNPSEKRLVMFGSPKWRVEYAKRLDDLLAPLEAQHIPTYWIALPVMRDETANNDAKVLNGLFVEATARHQVTYLPLWDITNSGEAYQAFGPDRDGHIKQLRQDDGVHYTMAGFDALALHLLETLHPTIEHTLKAKARAQAATAVTP